MNDNNKYNNYEPWLEEEESQDVSEPITSVVVVFVSNISYNEMSETHTS